ncbi:MAG: ATP-binding protein [Candidatus Aenigmarchaeota archaeon]|nr:ATP-binding protein [Candidatus Aenigmarchaeota archaeon]
MVFRKNLSDVNYDDIEFLLNQKIPESDILDYKQQAINDDDLVKDVCAFANTRGGTVVFGVQESGRGGYPVAIDGIHPSNVNKERMEQLILSNVSPRLHTRIHVVNHAINGNVFLLLQIPDSQYKPHYNNRTKKFHKRFEFQSAEMTEQEISDAYKGRFYTAEEVETYINNLTAKEENALILGNIIVIPSILDRRLINTDDIRDFSWLDPSLIDPKPSGSLIAPSKDYLPSFPQPFGFGITCKRHPAGVQFNEALKIHRNGCIQYTKEFGAHANGIKLIHEKLAIKILHTLQFATDVLSRYNYFGDVRIQVYLKTNYNRTFIKLPNSFSTLHPNDEDIIKVDREFSLATVEQDFSRISASIMNEIFNHYNCWNCHLFDKSGNYVWSEFNR